MIPISVVRTNVIEVRMVPEVESTNANCELTSMVSETSNACDAITFTLKVLNWTIRIEINIMKIIMPKRPYISILESEKKPALVRYDAENTREKKNKTKDSIPIPRSKI